MAATRFGNPALGGTATTQTGTLTNGQATITGLTSTTGLVVGQYVSASIAGLAGTASIQTINSGTQVTLSASFTGTTGSATITFYPAPSFSNAEAQALQEAVQKLFTADNAGMWWNTVPQSLLTELTTEVQTNRSLPLIPVER